MTVKDLIERVEEDLRDFTNPQPYEADEYYLKCRAKADYAEEILSLLKEIKKRVVMCVGTMPEDNYKDFEVFEVKQYETDEEAIERAKLVYSENETFYIKTKEK